MKISIGGVPEHFNFPWHYALSKGYFLEAGIDIHWQDYGGGTGAMATSLKANELDMALLLTEGAVKEIAGGANFKIARSFVKSPLYWGIHTAASNQKANTKDLTTMKFAISRLGSGSHLMVYVYAKSQGIALKEEQMVLVGDLAGARKALGEQVADLFFWERFMTKPLVDAGELKLLDIFPTPWPCFMLVAKNEWMQKYKETVLTICKVLDKTLEELSQNVDLASMIANKYKLEEKDVISWLSMTTWNQNFEVEKKDLTTVINALYSLRLITFQSEIKTLVHNTVTLV